MAGSRKDSAQFKPVSPPGYANATTEPRSESADFELLWRLSTSATRPRSPPQLPIRSWDIVNVWQLAPA